MSEPIGRVVRLQVHAEPLKQDGTYVPDPLVSVDRAVISADGMLGWNDNGWIIDTHHPAHPRAKGGGKRVLSIGFTGHYVAMADRFDSVPLGCRWREHRGGRPRRCCRTTLKMVS